MLYVKTPVLNGIVPYTYFSSDSKSLHITVKIIDFALKQPSPFSSFFLGMVISLESTEKFSSNILANLEMEMKVKAVKVDREIQDQMKKVEKRNKGRNQRTSMLRLMMRKKRK